MSALDHPTLLEGRDVVLGGPRGMAVTRTLPHRDVRMVGAWCFVDHYGPQPLVGRPGMVVPPHPHTGLQTVSWLVRGQIRHRDSLGNDVMVHPGQLNLMTAGRGISHAEHSLARSIHEDPLGTDVLHGVQLWIALPEAARFTAPAFEHHAELPVVRSPGARIVVLIGELATGLNAGLNAGPAAGPARSPATSYSPVLGAELTLEPGTGLELPLRTDFEHAVLVLEGAAAIAGEPLTPGPLLCLEPGASALRLATRTGARLLLLGGEPFEEQLVMWWNFVGRDHDEIVAFRKDWEAGGFGTVPGDAADVGARLPAPALPNARLAARPARRSRVAGAG